MANDQPTILQILPALDQGGVERGTVEIDNAVVAAGWKSVVVSSGGRLVGQLKGKHIRLAVNSKNPAKILYHSRVLKQIIADEKIDIIHARSRAPAWSAYLAWHGTQAHFITTFHGTYNIGNGLKKRYNSVMVQGEKIIAVSDFIRRHIVENYAIDPARIVTIHRGADLAKFNPQIPAIGLGLPVKKKIVMLPGRITRWKGQHIFVEAMRVVDAIGVIVGDVESYEYLRELEERLPDNIIILPGTADLAPVLANADVVVSASTKPEAFGRTLIEAQAMGKPVVATYIGGAKETVIDGKTGFFVKPGVVEELTVAIQKLLPVAGEFKAACVANAAEFSTEKMCGKTLELYKSFLKM